MSKLADENRRLREFIAASEACNAAVELLDMTDRYDELKSRCTDFLATLKKDMKCNVGSCPWCGEIWPNPSGDMDRVRAIAMMHDSECAQNPIRIECDALREQLRKESP